MSSRSARPSSISSIFLFVVVAATVTAVSIDGQSAAKPKGRVNASTGAKAPSPAPTKGASARADRPSVAIVPPVPIDGVETWLGLAVADNLALGLLRYQTSGKRANKEPEFPFTVFSWRETTSAARTEQINAGRPISPADVRKLARQLGARYVFTGSYRVSYGNKPRLLLKWRLTDTTTDSRPKDFRVTTNIATLSLHTEKLVAAVEKTLGMKPDRSAAQAKVGAIPLRALKAYAMGLEILARQSLEPHAQIILSPMELTKARMLFDRALDSAPTYQRARVASALTSAMLGEAAEAQKQVVQALTRSHGSDPFSAIGAYYLCIRENKPDDAIKILSDAVAVHPGFMNGLGYLGSAYLRAGQAQQAAQVFDRYKDRVPASPWARIMHARAMAYAGFHDAAIAETREVTAEFPGSVMAAVNLGGRLAQAKRYDEAKQVLQRALLAHPDNPALLTKLSYVTLQVGTPEVALELAQRAVALVGDGRGETMAGYAFSNLGHAQLLAGRKPEALKAFARAAELGVGVDERQMLLSDERTKAAMLDPTNPLSLDAPPAAPKLAGPAASGGESGVTVAAAPGAVASPASAAAPTVGVAATTPVDSGSDTVASAKDATNDDAVETDDDGAQGDAQDDTWSEDETWSADDDWSEDTEEETEEETEADPAGTTPD